VPFNFSSSNIILVPLKTLVNKEECGDVEILCDEIRLDGKRENREENSFRKEIP
jgi:hypothetical protein